MRRTASCQLKPSRTTLARGRITPSIPEAAMRKRSSGPVFAEKTATDRRRYRRYEMRVPVNYFWPSPQRRTEWGNGVTRDISPKGVFVVSPSCPPRGTIVRIEVLLPSLHRNSSPIHMCGQAKVVRAESGQGSAGALGFAVEVAHFSLHSKSKLSTTRTASSARDVSAFDSEIVAQDAARGEVEEILEFPFAEKEEL